MTERKDKRLPRRETSLYVLGEPVVRVSMATLARVESQGQYCLIRNWASSKASGHPILTPIGGGIHGTQEGIGRLGQLIGLDSEAVDKKLNLRFLTTGANTGALRDWFMSRTGREISVARELVDELAEQNPLVPPDLLQGATYSPGGYYAEFTPPRPGITHNTLRMVDVSDVTLPSRVIDLLREHAQKPVDEGKVRFVTAEEIESGQTTDGIEIGSVTRAIIHAKPFLPVFR